jgi:IS30 family transposase
VILTKQTQGDTMPKGYHHLTYDQRCQIYILKDRGDRSSKIANILKVHHSTIGRELKRNKGQRGYRHQQAQEKAFLRKNSQPNKKMTLQMAVSIEEKLKLQWSPIQISGWLKRHGKEQISHETIYNYIWKDKRQGGQLYKELRHQGKKYHKQRKGTSGRGCIPGRIDIRQRPSIVEKKTRLGDWELDTIIGAGHKGVIVSVVERTSKLAKVSHKTAKEVGQALIEQLKPIKAFVHTLTADNGKEFAYHQMVSFELEADFYFATPYHSWERGLNEHTNGLVRQYFPKTQSFLNITSKDIKMVETLLNSRPRKALNFETPLEAFSRLSANMLYSGTQ